ncbi:hypothetical protein DYB28_000116 [Aphanomyces astaci]|uniref:Adenylate kinase isoenzyme 6 homolog n=1 Tax=Aphanomyces astaci TaxID=112090 RepID=A0A397D7C9_APHAT|nr:hypothetical protein DYB34_001849 [Aphanomyces astaci]RHY59434.1 hypothetical protein DYB38_000536 [Aphanomyces astaci]RHY72623.1 hypothetical protein DYB30_001811 [Aphanomyces astaci]RLN99583.1 hypothetical protein DYB28_000116 [Aphanomyces astaci]
MLKGFMGFKEVRTIALGTRECSMLRETRSAELDHIEAALSFQSFGVYLVVWVAISISILHVLDVDYHSTFSSILPSKNHAVSNSLHRHRKPKQSVDQEYAAYYNFTQCYRQVDYGLLDSIVPTVVCQSSKSSPQSTTITHLTSLGWNDGSRWQNFALDFSSAPVVSSIRNASEEGGHHDPRYRLTSSRLRCQCDLSPNASSFLVEKFFPSNDTSMSWQCDDSSILPPAPPVVVVKPTALLVARKDDHNPFFQLAATLNAWALLKHLQIDSTTTQLFVLDDGEPMPTDVLMQTLLAPRHPVTYGRDVVGQTIAFHQAVFLPFEFAGPLVEHLNDEQLCHDSRLVGDFRADVFRAFGLPLVPHSTTFNATAGDKRDCIITIVSRRDYGGRRIARMWLNEHEMVLKMQAKYPMCTVQSVDFATKTMAEQIQLVAASRVVVGMHGAGMANVMFASPNTFVVEIFPLSTFRYGYRNLCQYLGLEYVEFRDGADTPWPESHKFIPEADWFKTFDLIMNVVLNDNERVKYDARQHVKEHELHAGRDEDFDCFILDEDKVVDDMDDMMSSADGGIVVDFHTCDFFPERWFDLVVVLRTDNTTLFDRLTNRGYTAKKVSENVECEIMQVVLQDAQESYVPEIVQELTSVTVADMETNVDRIVSWMNHWVATQQQQQ